MSKQTAKAIRKEIDLFLESLSSEDFPLWDLKEDPNAIKLVKLTWALHAAEEQ